MRRILQILAIGLTLLAAPAGATTMTVTYGNAGAQSADTTNLCVGTTTCAVGVENFDSRTTAQLTGGFTSNFVNSGGITITGTYSADSTAQSGSNLINSSANQYGGAGLVGSYPQLFAGSYTITLASSGVPGVNYFGLWISALDAQNSLSFYSGNNLLLAFTPTQMLAAINARSDKASYYGNPNNMTLNSNEPYAFVNFFATGGTFDRVVFSNAGGTAFESDNHTVAYRTPSPIIGNDIPAPWSISVMTSALAGLGWARRRRAA
jgi:hypothetical protein